MRPPKWAHFNFCCVKHVWFEERLILWSTDKDDTEEKWKKKCVLSLSRSVCLLLIESKYSVMIFNGTRRDLLALSIRKYETMSMCYDVQMLKLKWCLCKKKVTNKSPAKIGWTSMLNDAVGVWLSYAYVYHLYHVRQQCLAMLLACQSKKSKRFYLYPYLTDTTIHMIVRLTNSHIPNNMLGTNFTMWIRIRRMA